MNKKWDEHDPLEALAAGKREPFEEFVKREVRAVHGFFRHLGADPHESEDLAQELFVRLFRNSANYRPEGRFRAFVFRVGRNVWIDRQRARRATGGAEGAPAELASRAVEIDVAAAEREEAERASRAVAGLSERHRWAFELGVIRELPYAEVAAVLDVPVGTVKSRVHNAIRKLREALGPVDPEEART